MKAKAAIAIALGALICGGCREAAPWAPGWGADGPVRGPVELGTTADRLGDAPERELEFRWPGLSGDIGGDAFDVEPTDVVAGFFDAGGGEASVSVRADHEGERWVMGMLTFSPELLELPPGTVIISAPSNPDPMPVPRDGDGLVHVLACGGPQVGLLDFDQSTDETEVRVFEGAGPNDRVIEITAIFRSLVNGEPQILSSTLEYDVGVLEP